MTLSITGRCARTGQLGLAMSSYDMVFHFRPPHDEMLRIQPLWLAVANVGAVSAQASTRGGFSTEVMKLLLEGFPAQVALDRALEADDGDAKEQFQLAVVDAAGRAAAYTGQRALDWRGHVVGDGWVAAGNLLVGEEVVQAVGKSFENGRDLPLDERLLNALAAGVGAGGDSRGHRGGYLRVTKGISGSELDIRVYEHADPVAELRRLVAVYKGEDDLAATALKAADVIRASLSESDLERFGSLTTYDAVSRIRSELAGRGALPESLEAVDRILSVLSDNKDVGGMPFGEAMRMLLP